ncbi:acetyl/propionyl/methylcrotonyl-CoA carboxylase subunit alpha [Tahibacter soli]|uniref:Biotin carboxylase n=1 Tax=Tahibacter soli TaxID=2983605 RepID=A0A9X3YNK9_9GAMM|nr:acetyl-CoA carboxylase biotin carboxylase subunit [Tahibacter soli]MDC8014515.1 acetyl-CoA carboxylase biotin carboxylase subunit [Tahibacter soli]
MHIGKVLIANRGEIAVRIARTCARLGVRTVAVYSDADRDAPHVRAADAAVAIGPAPAAASYLSIGRIVDAARASGADAVHPGYGFLSERADFAQAVLDAGLVFVGPDPAAIAAMGDKAEAKRRMRAAGVPCVPGYDGDAQDDATLIREAERIGVPVMIKAVAGGGGRGMRLVHDAARLCEALASARAEAASAFGDARLLLERAVTGARHVEIQVFGDRHGNVVHLGERDCSVQRRHQKIVEEAPSPALDDALRARMGNAAVAAAQAVGYVGAGTVEFLLARDGAFYFLEMNTRLQVEHPVTERVYGVDLVEWQLRVAQGEPLPMSQADVLARRAGHAIEVRLCAEDAAAGFLPQTGTVLAWSAPVGEGVRVDHGVRDGLVVGAHYDSMLAKVIAHGATREDARRRLAAALERTVLLGIATNRDYLRRIVEHEVFAAGDADTGFIENRLAQPAPGASASHHALAAVALVECDARALARDAGFEPSLAGWNTVSRVVLQHEGATRPAQVRAEGATRRIVRFDDGSTHVVDVHDCDEGRLRYGHNGVDATAAFARDGDALWIDFGDRCGVWRDVTYAPATRADAASDGRIAAPIDGRVVAVQAQPGAVVRKGDVLVVLEAMKMEFRIASRVDGTVESVACAVGMQVRARQELAVVAAL